MRVLAVVGSQRMNGNSYLLTKTVLEDVRVDHAIVQLADKNIGFCTLCQKCIDDDCPLDDDFNGIVKEMEKADGIIFAVPRYLFFPAKFLCFLERMDNINHMRQHKGYKRTFANRDYRLFSDEKPFCIFAVSGEGKIQKWALKTVAEDLEGLGLKLVRYDERPYYGISVKGGEEIGEVLGHKEGFAECQRLAEKLVDSIRTRG